MIGTGGLSCFIGDLKVREALTIISLHLILNSLTILLTGLYRIFDVVQEEGNKSSDAGFENFQHFFEQPVHTCFFCWAAGGTGLMCLTVSMPHASMLRNYMWL